MIISNPNPVVPQPFAGMWITSLLIKLPAVDAPGLLEATLQPYDGDHLLMNGGKIVRHALPSSDPQTTWVLNSLTAEVIRQRGGEETPISIVVLARDPALPVSAMIKFGNRKFYRIPDCFALAATDQTFAVVLVTTMAEVARLAGLEFTVS